MKATAKCERMKMKYDRISSVLVNAKAGIEHLADKLVFFIVRSFSFCNIYFLSFKENQTLVLQMIHWLKHWPKLLTN